MSNNLRICEVIGVQIGERFRIVDNERGFNSAELYIDESGYVQAVGATVKDIVSSILLSHAINYPESVVKTIQHLTSDEIEICRVLGAKYITRSNDFGAVDLWRSKPVEQLAGYYTNNTGEPTHFATIGIECFPSIKPCSLICLDDYESGGLGA